MVVLEKLAKELRIGILLLLLTARENYSRLFMSLLF